MPGPTVLVTASAFRESAPHSEAPLREAGCRVLYAEPMGPLSAGALVPFLRRAEAVIAASDPYNGPVLDAAPRLRVIARWGTGCDTVDLEACTARGVAACNAPGLNVEAVADHTLMTMLALARHLPRQVAVIRSGGWEEVRGTELWRKTVGLAGFGAIGRAVARRLSGFECRLLAYDPGLPPEAVRAGGAEPAGLEELFRLSDFVSLHAALTPHNRGMVGESLLRSMRPTACFLNAARGALVDEEALVRALREGWIAGAAIDAFAEEPLPPEHPLRHLPNCLATPHSAFNTVETAAAVNRTVVEQVLAVLRGEVPPFLLNPEVLGRTGPRAGR